MRKCIVLLVSILLAGCAAVVKVEGQQWINDRLSVTLPDAWNRLTAPGQPYSVWTQEGASLDQLRFWAAVAPGTALVKEPTPRYGEKPPRVPTFVAGMAPDQLVSLFEVIHAADGSSARITRVEPERFAGEPGLRFEFEVVRKHNDLQLHGVGWVMVRNDHLYAATFMAPQLSFYARLLPKVEAVVKTARVKG